MSEFIYLYRGGKRPESPAEGEREMQKWIAWFKDMAAKGQVKSQGQPLEREVKLVSKGGVVTDGPFAEAKDIIGGYSVIEAKDLAQAAEIAKGCPIFDNGGAVEVRPVMSM